MQHFVRKLIYMAAKRLSAVAMVCLTMNRLKRGGLVLLKTPCRLASIQYTWAVCMYVWVC